MKFLNFKSIRATSAPQFLIATAFLAVLSLLGSTVAQREADVVAMYFEPASKNVVVDDVFTVNLMVKSTIPVNVFAGELRYDVNNLEIKSIDYNISIADLWAERPWYSNGEGVLVFGGGTTKFGGFTGNDTLISVTFKSKAEGRATLTLEKPRILLHDGLGTDATVSTPDDAIFFAETTENSPNNTIIEGDKETLITIMSQPPSTDLNGDGTQGISDISIFMLNMSSNDPKYDFNLDGKVNLQDLNILMGS